MILIERDGTRQLVASLDGYDGWTVVEANVPAPRIAADRETMPSGRRAWIVRKAEILAARAVSSAPHDILLRLKAVEDRVAMLEQGMSA